MPVTQKAMFQRPNRGLRRAFLVIVYTTLAIFHWPESSLAVDRAFFAPLDHQKLNPNCAIALKETSKSNQVKGPLVHYGPSVRKHVKAFLERQITDLTKKSPATSVLSDPVRFTQTRSILEQLMRILDQASVFTYDGLQLDLSVLHQMRTYLEAHFPDQLKNRSQRGNSRQRRRINELAELFRTHHLADAPQFSHHSAIYLDVGAGSGHIASGVAKAIGISSSKTLALELAQYPNAATDVQWISYDENGRIPLPDESVDILTLLMVFHHAPDPQHLIAEVYRVAKPGATILVRETNADHQPHLKLTSAEMVSLNQILDNMLYVVFTPNSGVPMMNNYRPKAYWHDLFVQTDFTVTELATNEIGSPFQPMFFILTKPQRTQ